MNTPKGAAMAEDALTATYELLVCGFEKNPRYCVYLNDHRIAGSKPWGGTDKVTPWKVSLKDLCDAVPAIRNMQEALAKIAAGEGIYGAQAAEYKAIARAAITPTGDA